MKPIIIPILLTCGILNAQEPTIKDASLIKLQELTGSGTTLNEVLANNPSAVTTSDESLTAHWMDFDDDGDYDLITVAADENKSICIFKNIDGEYQLVNKTVASEFSLPEVSILINLDLNADIAWFDKNLDGYKDFFLTIEGTPYQAEYLSNGDGSFQKLSEELAVNR